MTNIPNFADTVISNLKLLGDPKRAEGEAKYFKGTINCLGTGLPSLQKLENQMWRGLDKEMSVDEAMQLCDILLEKRIFEVTLFAFTFLDRFADKVGESELLRCEKWLEDDLCDNWAATDHLCPHVVGKIIENHPHLAARVQSRADSQNQWVKRASSVSFILLLRKGMFLDTAYAIAETLFSDKDNDLVQKGNGWMLREAGTTDPDRLERFLLIHGLNIPRTTLRYAIEKYPTEKRSELLTKTKKP